MSDVTDLKAEVLLLRQENKELRHLCEDLYQLAEDFDGDSPLWDGIDGRMDELGVTRWD